MNQILYLPVSIGEAIDKLSILDIKKEKITDGQKKTEVSKEFDLLSEKLKEFIHNHERLYDAMKKINLIIWDQMNILRDGDKNDKHYLELCRECIVFNDIRFRIKNKINLATRSTIKEQKSYRVNALVLSIDQDVQQDSILLKLIEALSYAYDGLEIHSDGNIDEIKVRFLYDSTILFGKNPSGIELHLDEENYQKYLEENKIVGKIFELI